MTEDTDPVKRFFDLPAYCGKRFNIRIRRLLVERMVGDVAELKILDLGCGDGSLSLPWLEAARELTLVDISENMLERVRAQLPEGKAATVRLVCSDLLAFDPQERFDLVLCVGVLAHLAAESRPIERLARLVAPGGRLVLQLTDADSAMGRLQHHWQRWRAPHGYQMTQLTATGTLDEAACQGLALVELRRYGLLPPGLRWLPDEWLYRWHLATLERPRLSRYGSEVIATLVREREGGAL